MHTDDSASVQRQLCNDDVHTTGVDSKTLLIVQVSPVLKNVSKTVSMVLNFAWRARGVELQQVKEVHFNSPASERRPQRKGHIVALGMFYPLH